MTFVEIVNAVLLNAFDETLRGDAKNWVNARLAWMCDIEDWSFMEGSDPVTVTAGSQAVTGVPTDFAAARALYRADGEPLVALVDYDDFAARYVGTSNAATGLPEAYVVVGASIFVGPTSSETSTSYTLVYQKAATPMVGDSDTPPVPAGYHMALVHGGKAEGFKLTNVPLSAQFDADFQAAITSMRQRYLRSSRPRVQQTPAYRPY